MKLHSNIFLILFPFISSPSFSNEASGRTVALIYPDESSTLFLKAVLDSMNLSFKEAKTPAGQKIEWRSASESQEIEIQNRVSQYVYLKTVCKSKELPPPTRPALTKLSCRQ